MHKINHLRNLKRIIFSLSIALITNTAHASDSPWFTGPILALSGKTLPRGHTNIEVYSFNVHSNGRYNDQSHFESRPASDTAQFSGIFGHGLSDSFDMQFSFPLTINKFNGQTNKDIGDMVALLGYQVMTQPEGTWWPNLRVALQESVPTGKFDRLSTTLRTTDDHGKGSYLTTLSFNFQTLFQPFADHYLRTFLSLGLTEPSTVHVQGVSIIGGTRDTNGSFNPGLSAWVDLAGEFTINQNLVVVMEALYGMGAPLHFTGFPGLTNLGQPLSLESGKNRALSYAPALEYNFTANFGVIAGVWFSVLGQNISQFCAPVFAVNAYW